METIGLLGGLGVGAAIHYYRELAAAHDDRRQAMNLVKKAAGPISTPSSASPAHATSEDVYASGAASSSSVASSHRRRDTTCAM